MAGNKTLEFELGRQMLTDDWQLYEDVLQALSLKVPPGRALRQYDVRSRAKPTSNNPKGPISEERKIASGQRDLARNALTSLVSSDRAEIVESNYVRYIRQVRYVRVPAPPLPGTERPSLPIVPKIPPARPAEPVEDPISMDLLRHELDKLRDEMSDLRSSQLSPLTDSVKELETSVSFIEKALGLRRKAKLED